VLIGFESMKKTRSKIPGEIAARVLFENDRTCVVCRQRGKPVQIHHLDDDPGNHEAANLAVLCFDCHRETQIRGGFDRKLDAEQIILYRNDWLRQVQRQRATEEAYTDVLPHSNDREVELATSVAEIYRENQQYELLAMHYHLLGNAELRDKYIELALVEDPTDQSVVFLRQLQRIPELIPESVIERETRRYTRNKAWSQRARFFHGLNRHEEAIADYLQSILESLQEGNFFSAAFYLRELQEKDLLKELQVMALRQAEDGGEMWWQVRSLEELGWGSELHDLLLNNKDEILESGNPSLQAKLAVAMGDMDRYIQLRKTEAENAHTGIFMGKKIEGEQDEGT
jgi:tetratricopeptide (TPR) repeat protein